MMAIEMKKIKGILSRGMAPFFRRYGINQKRTNQMSGRKAAGATDESPANRESKGRLVIGIKIKMAAQATTNERLPRRFSRSITALNLYDSCHPKRNNESDARPSQDQVCQIIKDGFWGYGSRSG